MDKILSICIPTYNRRPYLERCIRAIRQQCSDEIEVIISDNCSHDDTEQYCLELIKDEPRIVYKRHESNLGADGNFLWCLNNAAGKYIHILADDDYFKEGSIEKLLNECRNNDFTFAIINSGSCIGNNLLNDGAGHWDKYEKSIYNGVEEVERFLEKINIWLTFISGLIFNREKFLQVKNPEQYCGSYFLQTHIVMNMLRYGMTTMLMPSAMVYAEANNSSGYNIYRVFVKNWKTLLYTTTLESGISRKTLNVIYNISLKDTVAYFVREEKFSEGFSFQVDHKWRYLLLAWKYKNAWRYVYPFAIIPKWFIKIVRKIKHAIKVK